MNVLKDWTTNWWLSFWVRFL